MTFYFGSGVKILVILLLLLHSNQVHGVKCFECEWNETTEGVDLDLSKDSTGACRPETFDSSAVPIVDCEYGCVTSVITKSAMPRKSELHNHKSLRPKKQKLFFGKPDSSHFNLYEDPNYTMLMRGCSKKNAKEICEYGDLQDGCEKKSCYCKTDLCNSGSEPLGSDLYIRAAVVAGRLALTIIVRNYWIG